MSGSPELKRTRVCIVGAGASGSACAHALSQHPNRFEVVVFDKEDVTGGMATSIPLDAQRYGASFINDGVQGCSPAFANTIRLFAELGYSCSEVEMQISFGKGDDFWTNVYPTRLTRQFQSEIKRFGKVLKIIKSLEAIFAFVSVRAMLKMFRFSQDFGEKMVYPLVALFFGTGNQTPYVSSAILERVFLDPSMKLFEYNEDSLLASIPTMYGFPKLHEVYSVWRDNITSRGNVTFRLKNEVVRIVNRNNKREGEGKVVLEYKTPDEGEEPKRETFDELVLACDADTALRLLGKCASWKERQVLGGVKYLYDITITHGDLAYMQKHYETRYNPSHNADSRGKEDEEAFEFAEKNFRPLYYTLQYPQDKEKIEMSFDLTHYQPQFRGEHDSGRSSADARSSDQKETVEQANTGSIPEERTNPPLHDHVFQTIFLDRDGSQDLWTWNEIKEGHRIYEKWWKQQSHRWQHYAMVVPFMMFINGRNHTHFAGSWTVLNMHELAITSGFAAAYQLGAEYPFKDNEECTRLFRLYLALSHGARMRKEDRSGFFS